MKDTTLRDDDHSVTDHPCAQPICRHSRDDHRDRTGAESGCQLCACSAYVSRSRMIGRRLFWAMTTSGRRPGSPGTL
jgi:hypothetical protein